MPTTGSPWPDGKQAAISLTFDDGAKSQLERAIPYLNKLGLPGTFYLNPRDDWRERLKPWREVAAAGHEIGNHTVGHPCSRALWGQEHGLETMTLEQLESDIVTAEERLREAIPEQTERTFCYPCYYHHVGSGRDRQSYVPLIARHFIAGRGGTCNLGFAVAPSGCDLAYLEGHPAERLAGYELIGLCERAAARGHWLLLVFHGIQEGALAVADGDFRELCDHLKRFEDRFWTATVLDAAKRVKAWRG
ncbi:MAG: polysaccharide deacetylase family protein [Planctomycetota bacterium]|nr:polysaccharide deacetylase family protein [Planctomycetota bacterium]